MLTCLITHLLTNGFFFVDHKQNRWIHAVSVCAKWTQPHDILDKHQPEGKGNRLEEVDQDASAFDYLHHAQVHPVALKGE